MMSVGELFGEEEILIKKEILLLLLIEVVTCVYQLFGKLPRCDLISDLCVDLDCISLVLEHDSSLFLQSGNPVVWLQWRSSC